MEGGLKLTYREKRASLAMINGPSERSGKLVFSKWCDLVNGHAVWERGLLLLKSIFCDSQQTLRDKKGGGVVNDGY